MGALKNSQYVREFMLLISQTDHLEGDEGCND